MVQLSELARKYAPWSTTKLEQAKTCPAQFERQYVLKHKKEIQAQDNRVGIIAHRIIELMLPGLPFADAQEAAIKELPVTSNESAELQCHREAIEQFVARFSAFRQREGEKQLFIEQKWANDFDGNAIEYASPNAFFRGIVDLALLSNANDLWIIDHKSGKVADLTYKSAQLDSYAILGSANVPNIVGTRSGINALSNPQATRLQWSNYIDLNQIRRGLLPWLMEYVNQCASNLRTFDAKPKKPWPCNWCPYSPSCVPYQGLTNGAKKGK